MALRFFSAMALHFFPCIHSLTKFPRKLPPLHRIKILSLVLPEDLLLRQEKESTCQNTSRVPCPSSFLAAASMIRDIMDAADAERKQSLFEQAEKCHKNEKGGEMDGRWTASGAAHCQKEKEGWCDNDLHFRDGQRRLHQYSFQGPHTTETSLQQELVLRVPSLRPGRPFRNRGTAWERIFEAFVFTLYNF
jgi:hypothetical protein